MNYSIEKQCLIYKLLLAAMYSDNTDYIKEQLEKIYNLIIENNL